MRNRPIQYVVTAFMAIAFMLVSGISFAGTKEDEHRNSEDIRNEISELKRDVKSATNDMELIRRDQLNYSIEKNLLKEAYSSNIESIQIIISIVLGIFTVLGYLGFKNINQLKDSYAKELEELKEIKSDFEKQLRILKEKHEEFESKVDSVNETQDRRLKLLELIEKVSEIIRAGQWKWALEHIAVGLEIDPQNLTLLTQQGLCQGKLGEFKKAIATWKKILESSNADKSTVASAVVNSLEYLALENNREEFDLLISKYQNEVEQYQAGGAATAYLKALIALVGNDLMSAITELEGFASKFRGIQKNHIEGWSFDEVLNLALKWEDGYKKQLVLNTTNFFSGAIPSDNFISFLVEVKAKL